MSSRPLVSVIIPFLNAERFIQEAIESVLAQTYGSWELLLVDDGSSDRSSNCALLYAEGYPEKVRYLEHEHHQNQGASASRNLGIRHAKGEYIAFLDADDIWLAHKLERQVAIMESQPEAAMVYGPTQFWFSWTGNPEDSQRDFVTGLGAVPPNTLVRPPVLLFSYLKNQPPVPLPTTIMVRRKVAEGIGGFEEAFRVYEDAAFAAKLCLNASVFVAGECWARYRLHPDSAVSNVMKIGLQHSARFFFLNWLKEYLSKQAVKDVEIWEALEKELWPYRHRILYYLLAGSRHLIEQMRRTLYTTRMITAKLKRLALGRSTGLITVSPNPIQVSEFFVDRFPVGATSLSWTSKNTETVEIRVGAPDGPIFSRTGPSGSATTGPWVHDGMVFFLQDVSGGLPLTLANTLATVSVRVIPEKKARTSLLTRLLKRPTGRGGAGAIDVAEPERG